ncbi:MAG: hypothetical protein ACRCWO_03770, partial [Bosea sp. (in: a-proteobacteria)]
MTKETMPETNRSPVAENVRLTSLNFEEATRSLTHAERYAMQFAMKLSFGELTITLPRGPSFVVGGTGDGPKADLIVHDLSCARRLLSGGDIGFAEAY